MFVNSWHPTLPVQPRSVENQVQNSQPIPSTSHIPNYQPIPQLVQAQVNVSQPFQVVTFTQLILLVSGTSQTPFT